MHELSIAEGVVALIEEAADREGFSRTTRVFMEIGQLSCVSPDALRTALEHAARDTCLDGAELVLADVAAEGICSRCAATATMETIYDMCPRCGAHPMNIRRGLEMRVTELDVE